MRNSKNIPAKPLSIRQDKDSDFERLKQFVLKSDYIDIVEQPKVCEAFNLPFAKKLFQDVYRERFCEYLIHNTTTVATVERETGIPQKYLTVCKLYYEKRGLLKVVGIGICPTTKSTNVQFVTTNPESLISLDSIVINGQLKLL